MSCLIKLKKYIAIFCLTALLTPFAVELGLNDYGRIQVGAQQAEAIGFRLLLKIHRHRVLDINLAYDILNYALESLVKRVMIIAIHSLLRGENPAEAIKDAINGLGKEMVSKFDDIKQKAMSQALGALNEEIGLSVEEVKEKISENAKKLFAQRDEAKKITQDTKGPTKPSRMYENLPPLAGMQVTGQDTPSGPKPGQTEAEAATNDGTNGLPGGNPGIYTAVTGLSSEKNEMVKSLHQYGLPASSMPAVLANTAIQNAAMATTQNALDAGSLNVGIEARQEMMGIILALVVSNSELREAMSRVADSETESTTVSDWRTQGNNKAYKAWYDFLKSRIANHSRGTGLLLATMQTLRAKDRMLATLAGQRTQTSLEVVRRNMERYHRVGDREFMRLMK